MLYIIESLWCRSNMVSPSHASVSSHSTDSFCKFDSLCLKGEILSEAKNLWRRGISPILYHSIHKFAFFLFFLSVPTFYMSSYQFKPEVGGVTL